MNNLFSLKNQTILVTGSLGLIGKEITKSLYDFGATLILTDIPVSYTPLTLPTIYSV